MPLHMVRDDIVTMKVDAILNPSDEKLSGSGGLDQRIHQMAGPKLDAKCRRLRGCLPGQVKLTKGYHLPCKYIIHTAGPRWQGGDQGEAAVLADCYRNALTLANQRRCRSVALPLISTGLFGYPKEQALRLAVDSIRAFLLEAELEVYLVLFHREAYTIGKALFSAIDAYIDDCYAQRFQEDVRTCQQRGMEREELCRFPTAAEPSCALPTRSLAEMMAQMDESFSQMLLREIDARGMTDVQCYKKANVSRKLFSKIRSDPFYRPSKPTVIAFALALELSLTETEEMLRKAGFALSRSNKFDLIIAYFIQQGIYDVFSINEALFYYDQPLLGL